MPVKLQTVKLQWSLSSVIITLTVRDCHGPGFKLFLIGMFGFSVILLFVVLVSVLCWLSVEFRF